MKKVWSSVLVLILVLSLTACGSEKQPEQEADIAEESTQQEVGLAEEEKLDLVFVSKMSGDFWSYMEAGMKKAAEENDVNLDIVIPNPQMQADRQIAVFEDALNAGPDAILMAPVEQDALVEPAKTAMEQGIPVILVDSRISTEDFVTAFCTDNLSAGAKAADQMAEVLGEEGGTVAIYAGSPSSNSDLSRANGFIDRVAEKYPQITVMEPQYNNGDAATTSTQVLDTITANPDLTAIYCINGTTTIAAGNSLLQLDRKDIVLGGFDAYKDQIELLNKEIVTFLVVQQPYQMGYQGVNAAVQAAQGNTPEHEVVDTGCFIVTQDNKDTEEAQSVMNPLD